jgi:predicted RNA methylase
VHSGASRSLATATDFIDYFYNFLIELQKAFARDTLKSFKPRFEKDGYCYLNLVEVKYWYLLYTTFGCYPRVDLHLLGYINECRAENIALISCDLERKVLHASVSCQGIMRKDRISLPNHLLTGDFVMGGNGRKFGIRPFYRTSRYDYLEGYCYLRFICPKSRELVATKLGPYPSMSQIKSQFSRFIRSEKIFKISYNNIGIGHLTFDSSNGLTFDELYKDSKKRNALLGAAFNENHPRWFHYLGETDADNVRWWLLDEHDRRLLRAWMRINEPVVQILNRATEIYKQYRDLRGKIEEWYPSSLKAFYMPKINENWIVSFPFIIEFIENIGLGSWFRERLHLVDIPTTLIAEMIVDMSKYSPINIGDIDFESEYEWCYLKPISWKYKLLCAMMTGPELRLNFFNMLPFTVFYLLSYRENKDKIFSFDIDWELFNNDDVFRGHIEERSLHDGKQVKSLAWIILNTYLRNPWELLNQYPSADHLHSLIDDHPNYSFLGLLYKLYQESDLVYNNRVVAGSKQPILNLSAELIRETREAGIAKNTHFSNINNMLTKAIAKNTIIYPYGETKEKFEIMNAEMNGRLIPMSFKDSEHANVKFLDNYYKYKACGSILKKDVVLFIGPKLREVVDFLLMHPHITPIVIFGEMDGEDYIRHEENRRFAQRLMEKEKGDKYFAFDGIYANCEFEFNVTSEEMEKRTHKVGLVPKKLHNILSAFLNYLAGKSNPYFFNRSTIHKCAMTADIGVAFNNLYDLTPENVAYYMAKFNIKTILATRINCVDLFTMGTSRNSYLGVQFTHLTKNKIAMTFTDGPSKGYVHNHYNLQVWNEYTKYKTKAGIISYSIEEQHLGYEYLTISLTKSTDLEKILFRVPKNTQFVRLVKIQPYLDYGRVEYFYVDRLKYTKIKDFCLRLSFDNFEPSKITTMATSIKNTIVVGDQQIQHAWEIDDLLFHETIMFVITFSSLEKGEFLNQIIKSIELSKAGGFTEFWLTKKFRYVYHMCTLQDNQWKVFTDLTKLLVVPEMFIWEPNSSSSILRRVTKLITKDDFASFQVDSAFDENLKRELANLNWCGYQYQKHQRIIKTFKFLGLASTVHLWVGPYISYKLFNKYLFNCEKFVGQTIDFSYECLDFLVEIIKKLYEICSDFVFEPLEDFEDDDSVLSDVYNPVMDYLSNLDVASITLSDVDGSESTTSDSTQSSNTTKSSESKEESDDEDEGDDDDGDQSSKSFPIDAQEEDPQEEGSGLKPDQTEEIEEDGEMREESSILTKQKAFYAHDVCLKANCEEHKMIEEEPWNSCLGDHGYKGEANGLCHICKIKDKIKGAVQSELCFYEAIQTEEEIALQFKNFVLKNYNITKSTKIIDVGAGTGTLIRQFNGLTNELTALEKFVEFQDHEDWFTGARWIFKDIKKLKGNDYDLVISHPPLGCVKKLNNVEMSRKFFKTAFRMFQDTLVIIQTPNQVEYIIKNFNKNKKLTVKTSKIFKMHHSDEDGNTIEIDAQFLMMSKLSKNLKAGVKTNSKAEKKAKKSQKEAEKAKERQKSASFRKKQNQKGKGKLIA